jgi:transcriptional regulator with XRE-family HTH domain
MFRPVPAREVDQALGGALRRLREERGVTQEAVAHAAGLTVTAVARVERGQTDPAWSTVRRIAAALDLDMGELGSAVDANG